MEEGHNILFTYDDSVLDEVVACRTEVESGARKVDNILTNTLLPEVSGELLSRLAEGKELSHIRVTDSEDSTLRVYVFRPGTLSCRLEFAVGKFLSDLLSV